MEYEERRRVVRQDDEAAFSEFVGGLQLMSTLLERHVDNFAWCAAQIAGSSDAPARIRGMMEFALRLREFGFEAACQAVEKNAGIRVNVAVPRTGRNVSGIVVGLTDASYHTRFFKGVAVVANSRGQEAFVNVRIRPNGATFLHLEDQQPDQPETRRLMRDLTPPAGSN